LGSGGVESLADLLRTFNHQQGVEVAYEGIPQDGTVDAAQVMR
jgi:hypothetical protein